MKLIKLDATDSTNTFLKEMERHTPLLEDFTVVWTLCQRAGRGQYMSRWVSQDNKNLTFSVLLRFEASVPLAIHSMYVACGVVEALRGYGFDSVCVKWPNDILWGSKKIGGILIENRISSDQVISVVGIGINVLQQRFEGLPQASSLLLESGQVLDIKELLVRIVEVLEKNYTYDYNQEKVERIRKTYHEMLFKRGVPCVFEEVKKKKRFVGCIEKVDNEGNLHLRREDGSQSVFSLKEIQMLY